MYRAGAALWYLAEEEIGVYYQVRVTSVTFKEDESGVKQLEYGIKAVTPAYSNYSVVAMDDELFESEYSVMCYLLSLATDERVRAEKRAAECREKEQKLRLKCDNLQIHVAKAKES